MAMFITDQAWEALEPVLKVPRKSQYGRPRADERECFEAVLFVLHTGIQWKHLPRTFPPKSTVHDYLQHWVGRQAFRQLLARVVGMLVQRGRIDLEECFIDATFAPAKAGGQGVGLTRKGKGTKMQLIVDAEGLPLGVSIGTAGQGENKMVQGTLELFAPETQPERLIGDKAYDDDALDATLAELGIEMISPHRSNRLPENVTQDGRPLRRYKRRWKVERTIAWLGNHRRLLVRYDKQLSVFTGFTLLGCLMIVMRHLT
ncbi:IS5 family transposase [Phragmitibacter flavus]|uniref:IS5 family transposase n=1 Tax=Phragmitibacter flavus TaxID=2576071 RepID=A0A5R8KGS4_9BACT|nr:IS5 family transposase [Phragmitibacter flavus]TLD71492.1 IS5 family transposase [Phragmitibacter flavus]